MKTSIAISGIPMGGLILGVILSTATGTYAQNNKAGAKDPVGGGADQKRQWTAVDADGNYRVWTAPGSQSAKSAAQGAQKKTAASTSRIVEIGSGLDYWDGHRWNPSV